MKNVKQFLVTALAGTVAVVAACTGSKEDDGPVDELVLPGDSFYPESITADADGALYVSSLATGEVVKFAAGETTHTEFIAAGGTLSNATGVFADDATSTLWVCSVDITFTNNSTLEAFDLADGSEKTSYAFPAFGLCNDMDFDGSGNLFVADSLGRILRLESGGTTLAVWSTDGRLAPSSPDGFGADGIVVDGDDLYVNTFSDSRLLRIPIMASGTAGEVVEIAVTPALVFPDGMRRVDANTLVVAEGVGTLRRVVVSGTTATSVVLQSDLAGPTSVIRQADDYWVSEGQLDKLFSGTDPDLPFTVKRVPVTQ